MSESTDGGDEKRRHHPTRLAFFFTGIVWLAAIVSTQSKQYLPHPFGAPLFQFSFAAVGAISAPLATLCCLHVMTFPWLRGKGFCILMLASLPLICYLIAFGPCGIVMEKTQSTLSGIDGMPNAALQKLADAAKSMESPARRKKAAQVVFHETGVPLVWKDEAGEFKEYSPEPEDFIKQKEHEELRRTIQKTQRNIDHLLRQFPRLFGLHLGSYVLIMAIGLGIHSYRKAPAPIG